MLCSALNVSMKIMSYAFPVNNLNCLKQIV